MYQCAVRGRVGEKKRKGRRAREGGLKWKEVDAKRGQIRHTSRVGYVGVDPRHQGQRDGLPS